MPCVFFFLSLRIFFRSAPPLCSAPRPRSALIADSRLPTSSLAKHGPRVSGGETGCECRVDPGSKVATGHPHGDCWQSCANGDDAVRDVPGHLCTGSDCGGRDYAGYNFPPGGGIGFFCGAQAQLAQLAPVPLEGLLARGEEVSYWAHLKPLCCSNIRSIQPFFLLPDALPRSTSCRPHSSSSSSSDSTWKLRADYVLERCQQQDACNIHIACVLPGLCLP